MELIKIELTKEQYESLIKLVYLGNWMINAIRSGAPGDERVKKYDDIEQYIYFFAEEIGLEKYVEFDKESNQFFPTKEFEESADIEQYREEYDDATFWEELIHRLARRDFIKEYGEDVIRKMDWKERMEKEDPFIEKCEKEFEENGIENLELRV